MWVYGANHILIFLFGLDVIRLTYTRAIVKKITIKKYLTKSKKSFIIYIENNKGDKEMKIFRNIAIVISVLFILWFIVSYIQITSQNLDFESETVLSNWNLFKLFL